MSCETCKNASILLHFDTEDGRVFIRQSEIRAVEEIRQAGLERARTKIHFAEREVLVNHTIDQVHDMIQQAGR